MNLYLMRHGQTEYNERGCLQGQTPTRLNEKGRAQAELAGEGFRKEKLAFERIYCSPLPRALETAEIATGLPASEFCQDDRILEMYFGDYEGLVIKELSGTMMDFIMDPESVTPPEGVETVQSLRMRVGEFLKDLAKEPLTGNVLVVSHEICIHAMCCEIFRKTWNELNDHWLDNCGVYRLDGFGEKEQILSEMAVLRPLPRIGGRIL